MQQFALLRDTVSTCQQLKTKLIPGVIPQSCKAPVCEHKKKKLTHSRSNFSGPRMIIGPAFQPLAKASISRHACSLRLYIYECIHIQDWEFLCWSEPSPAALDHVAQNIVRSILVLSKGPTWWKQYLLCIGTSWRFLLHSYYSFFPCWLSSPLRINLMNIYSSKLHPPLHHLISHGICLHTHMERRLEIPQHNLLWLFSTNGSPALVIGAQTDIQTSSRRKLQGYQFASNRSGLAFQYYERPHFSPILYHRLEERPTFGPISWNVVVVFPSLYQCWFNCWGVCT